MEVLWGASVRERRRVWFYRVKNPTQSPTERLDGELQTRLSSAAKEQRQLKTADGSRDVVSGG